MQNISVSALPSFRLRNYLSRLMFKRIVTHNDLDGLVSAAICSAVHDIDQIEFTGPNHIAQVGFPVSPEDIVCDLPYPGECGLWFDHHEGNGESVRLIGKDPLAIPGAFALEKSCARVVYNFYKPDYRFPAFYRDTVKETDKIDCFDFKTIEEWRAETPVRIINDSLKCRFKDSEQEESYLQSLWPRLASQSLQEISIQEDVRAFYHEYLKEEERMFDIIRKTARFHSKDSKNELVFLDLTSYNKRIPLVRNLAQILYPEIRGVCLIQNLFDRGVKTNNFSLSGSLTIKANGKSSKNIGEIMRVLNIGDGHSGAGSGQVFCTSKAELETRKEVMVDKVWKIWATQEA